MRNWGTLFPLGEVGTWGACAAWCRPPLSIAIIEWLIVFTPLAHVRHPRRAFECLSARRGGAVCLAFAQSQQLAVLALAKSSESTPVIVNNNNNNNNGGYARPTVGECGRRGAHARARVRPLSRSPLRTCPAVVCVPDLVHEWVRVAVLLW